MRSSVAEVNHPAQHGEIKYRLSENIGVISRGHKLEWPGSERIYKGRQRTGTAYSTRTCPGEGYAGGRVERSCKPFKHQRQTLVRRAEHQRKGRGQQIESRGIGNGSTIRQLLNQQQVPP